MNSSKHAKLVEDFIAKYGSEELTKYLEKRLSPDNYTLTIIGNSGFHTIPEEYLHGEVYLATTGNLNLTSEENTLLEYKDALSALANKLREKSWNRIYFIPTGHTTLVLQIKLLVYHVLRISTVDLFYSKGNYFELDLDYRELLSSERS